MNSGALRLVTRLSNGRQASGSKLMNSVSKNVGIDIAKDHLDVFVQGQTRRFSNDADGIARLLEVLPEGAQVHYEPTGGHERLLGRMLGERGIAALVHNPRRVRRMADVLGVSAKTDALDAQVLARAGTMGKPQRPKSPSREELCDVSRTIQTLKAERSSHLKRLQTPQLIPAVIQALNQVIQALDEQIQVLEKAFVQMVSQSDRKELYDLAQSVPSVGRQTARVVVSELPEDFRQMSPRQIASYAGLAPFDQSSGKRKGPARIRHGNIHLKTGMYMAAVNCLKNQAWAKDLYARLRSKGRAHQQAIVAVMRRLLIRVLAVLKRGSAWRAEPLNA